MRAIRINPLEVAKQIEAVRHDPYSTTPISISETIQGMSLNLAHKAIYVPVEEVAGEEKDDCFNVVARKIKRDGGSIVHGWVLWEWPTMFVEGEHHAVWRNPDGVLIDVVPRPQGERRILFLPDPARVFNGLRTGNVRRQISEAEEVLLFLEASQKLEEVMGPEVGAYQLTKEMAELDIARGYFSLRMREMTPRKAVEAARMHARTPLKDYPVWEVS